MWCGHCQQDVPAVAAQGGEIVHCARCQQPLDKPAFAVVDDAGIALDPQQPTAACCDNPLKSPSQIETSRRNREIGRRLRTARSSANHRGDEMQFLRFDPASSSAMHQRTNTANAATLQAAVRRQTANQPAAAPIGEHRVSQFTAWLVAILGSASLGVGLGLIGWSIVGPRPDLWSWGLLATLGGQGLLIIGLVLLLGSLWTNARASTQRLQNLQSDLHRLHRAADAIAGDRSATAARFFGDLARAESPELLIANLYGQIDQLSTTIAKE